MSIRLEIGEGIATITLDRPERLNAFTPAMADDFIHALDQCDADDEIRAIIVTGAGRAFSAGADLSDGASAFDSAHADVSRDIGGLMTLRLFECTKPIVAAVNGAAVGVGASMLLAMDVRIASTHAKFGFVFVKRGLVPEAASSWFLPRIVGIAAALRWCLSGATVAADEALAEGLVSSLCEPGDLLTAARSIARQFAEGTAPVSVAMTRRMLWTMLGASHPMEAHILDSHALDRRVGSGDVQEGIAAFLEKRAPTFPDRVTSGTGDLFDQWTPRAFN